jgi:hypothetical protein
MASQFQKLSEFGEVEHPTQTAILVDDSRQFASNRIADRARNITSRIGGLGNPNNLVNGSFLDRFSWMNDKRKVVRHEYYKSFLSLLY